MQEMSAHLLQLVHDLPEILRQGGENHHGPAVPGVEEAEGARVKALAFLSQLRFLVSVDQITQDGMADVRHMDTDLMGAPRLQLTADMGIAPVAIYHFPVGHGLLGIPGGDAHLLPVRGVAADVGIDGAAVFF